VPDRVSDEQAALIEPLSVAMHAVRRSSFRPGDSALVIGGGPIGNLICQMLRAAGARAVVVSEVKPFRAALAERLGFGTVNPETEDLREALRRCLGEPSADHVFDVTGVAAAFRDAVEACKVRGEIVFVGIPKTPPSLDIQRIVFKEIRTSSSRVYERGDFRASLAMLERRALDVESLITDRLPLKDAGAAMERMLGTDTSVKILLAP
jgi:2-desacetyl-2-hydroxyethyl bacteriochlorophyllide A dehydrogenase